MADINAAKVVGRVIIAVRQLSGGELDAFHWDGKPRALSLVLDDGCEIIACADEELNGPGTFVLLSHDSAQRLTA